jgi:peptidoglycan/LPS O-acetylase OafA/YrhL
LIKKGPTVETPAQTSWPVKPYAACLAVCLLLTLSLYVSLDGQNHTRAALVLLVYSVPALRLIVAIKLKEQGRNWIGYVAGMVLFVPLIVSKLG